MMSIATRAMPHIVPVIKERRELMEMTDDSSDDRPVGTSSFRSVVKGHSSVLIQNDVLQWLIEDAVRKNHTDVEIVESLFLVNLAAIHNTSNVRST